MKSVVCVPITQRDPDLPHLIWCVCTQTLTGPSQLFYWFLMEIQ